MSSCIQHIIENRNDLRDYIINNAEAIIYELSIKKEFKLLKDPLFVQALINGISLMFETTYANKGRGTTAQAVLQLNALLDEYLSHYMRYGFSEKLYIKVCNQIGVCNSLTRPLSIFNDF